MHPKTILTVHNFYRQPGGEDEVFLSDAAVLERAGHTVIRYQEQNSRIANGLLTSISAVWNLGSYQRLSAIARESRPEVTHFHNTFPLVSPSGFYAVRNHGIPVVLQLHNFRLLCPGGALMRDGRVCESCLEARSLGPAIKHRCYRDSAAATISLAAMLSLHRTAGTWSRVVDAYIAPSDFVRGVFVKAGFPEDRIAVKPNPVSADPGAGRGCGKYAVFVGRLTEGKGISTLVEAWKGLTGIPLYVAGDGPFSPAWPPGVIALGRQSKERVFALMQDAHVVIVPSVWYETGPLTVLESFACGTPVIASDLGSMAERVEHERTGLLFRPGDAQDLAAKVRWAFDHPEQIAAMRHAARREFEMKYTAERNYKMLMDIYEMAIENARQRRSAA